jgi:hypothetical protein
VEKFWDLTHKWRYLVIALEAVVAAGCIYFGWRALATTSPAQSQVQVQHAPAVPPDPVGVLTLPWRQPAASPGRPALPRTIKPSLGTDTLARLDHDDFELYRHQWHVLQALTDGVRRYVEQRVVPRLLSH